MFFLAAILLHFSCCFIYSYFINPSISIVTGVILLNICHSFMYQASDYLNFISLYFLVISWSSTQLIVYQMTRQAKSNSPAADEVFHSGDNIANLNGTGRIPRTYRKGLNFNYLFLNLFFCIILFFYFFHD